jgi:hypothetical protein
MARVYKCTFMGRFTNGALVEPGVHYQTDLSAGGSEPAPDDVANAIWGHIGIPFQQATSTYVTVDELVVVEQVIPPAIGVVGAHSVGAPGLLSPGDDALPREMAALISWHTNTHSRSARGHTFMPNPGASTYLQGDKTWVETIMAQLQAFANACLGLITVGSSPFETTLRPVIYSRTRHLRGQVPFTFELSGATAKQAPTWLRSRGTVP